MSFWTRMGSKTGDIVAINNHLQDYRHSNIAGLRWIVSFGTGKILSLNLLKFTIWRSLAITSSYATKSPREYPAPFHLPRIEMPFQTPSIRPVIHIEQNCTSPVLTTQHPDPNPPDPPQIQPSYTNTSIIISEEPLHSQYQQPRSLIQVISLSCYRRKY